MTPETSTDGRNKGLLSSSRALARRAKPASRESPGLQPYYHSTRTTHGTTTAHHLPTARLRPISRLQSSQQTARA